MIEDVNPTGPLGERFDARGFKIVSIDDVAVTSVEQFEAALRQKPPQSIVKLLLVAPNGSERIINVRLP